MAKLNPLEFVQEVRQEVAKVTWPTWSEVWITTIMVVVMVIFRMYSPFAPAGRALCTASISAAKFS